MDETSTADRLKPNLGSGNTRPGFLILIVMMIGAALGLLLLNTYQQNIRTRFQSSAFLQNQLFFLELNRFVPHLIDHFRKQSLEQLTENRIPLEASDLPQELQHWNLESRLEGKYLHNTLKSSQRPDGVSFDFLLVLEKLDLTTRPWTLFSSSMSPPPEPVVMEAGSQNLLEWPNRPFWLPSSEDALHFGKILEGVESAVMNHNLMEVSYDNGSLQTILLEEDNRFIRISGSIPNPVSLDIDFETLASTPVFLDVEGDVHMEVPEGSGFLQNRSMLMIRIDGTLSFTRNSPTYYKGSAGGHLLISGEPCFRLDEGLSELFFLGSLSCDHLPVAGGILRLKHHTGPPSVPKAFEIDYLRFGGMLIRDD